MEISKKKLLANLKYIIKKYLMVYLNSIDARGYIVDVNRLDIQNYINTHNIKLDGISINNVLDIMSVYNSHLAYCNLYSKGNIEMPYGIKFNITTSLSKYKKDEFYIVYDMKTKNDMREIIDKLM